MANRIVPHASVRIVKHAFGWRYGLAAATRRLKLYNRAVTKALFDGDEMIVLPKDRTTKRKVIETDISAEDPSARTVLPSDVVKRILRRSEHIFIMNFCICRRSAGCEDYPRDMGCIFLGNGTLRIPDDFGHIATFEEASEYIDRCGELGLVHIIGKNRLDSVWLNTGKKNDLMTICNCCPCCCLWNFVRDVSDEIGSVYRKMESVEVRADPDKCVGCGICTESCFVRAIAIKDGKCSIDSDRCRGCGRCADICPKDAISVTFDPAAVGIETERLSVLMGKERWAETGSENRDNRGKNDSFRCPNKTFGSLEIFGRRPEPPSDQLHQSPLRSMVSSLSGPTLMMSAGTFRYLSMNSMYSLISPGRPSYPPLTIAAVSFQAFQPLRVS